MSKILYDTKYLQLKSTESKTERPWVYAHRPNASDVVVILPVYGEEILFLIEERPPLQAENRGKYCIGLPAGLVGDERKGETIEDAIKAELKEEAGLCAGKIEIKAHKSAGSSGCISETCVIAIAYINDKTIISKPVDDGGVIIGRIWVNKKDVLNWLNKKDEEGYVISSHTLGALFYLFAEGKI
jgi:ADP-ribose pyrophosphatase